MQEGGGIKLTKSAEVLRDILAIADLKKPEGVRLAESKRRIARYRAEANAFYEGEDDIEFRVQSALGTLRDAVFREIARRGELGLDERKAQFLEPVLDELDEMAP